MKAKVAANAAEITAGGGTQAYQDCLYLKKEWERKIQYRTGGTDNWFYIRSDSAIGSGLPEGTRAFTRQYVDQFEPTAPAGAGDYALTGRDSALFSPKWPGVTDTVRPLPQGTYKFYFFYRPKEYIICDGVPELEKKREEVFVTVTAPDGAVHEAFFDPVAIGTAVGADASNGVLDPKAFKVGQVSTSLQSLKWEGGSTTLSLSAAVSLSGHALDFIALDGTVAHSLDGGAATVSGNALTWSVASQPWKAGDKLMLRIRQGGPAPTW